MALPNETLTEIRQLVWERFLREGIRNRMQLGDLVWFSKKDGPIKRVLTHHWYCSRGRGHSLIGQFLDSIVPAYSTHGNTQMPKWELTLARWEPIYYNISLQTPATLSFSNMYCRLYLRTHIVGWHFSWNVPGHLEPWYHQPPAFHHCLNEKVLHPNHLKYKPPEMSTLVLIIFCSPHASRHCNL